MQLFADPVFLVELLMLSAVLAVGLYTSYTDLKVRLVPNRHTLGLLAIGLAGQVAMVSLGVTSMSRLAATILTALAIALGLTLFGFWSPGDAKLYWAAVVALPPSLCPSADVFSLQAAATALIVNALLCYVPVLLLVPLCRWDHREETQPDRALEGRQWLQAGWGLAGLLGLSLSFAWLVLARPLSYVEAFGALVIGYRLLERGLEPKYWPVLLVPGMVALLYVGKATVGWQVYVLMLGAVWLAELLYLQVRRWYHRAFVQSLAVSRLQPGIVPRRTLSFEASGGDSGPLCEAGKPLKEQQLKRLRALAREGRLPIGDTLEVEQAMPFVPFIVAGVMLTTLFAGNLVPPLIDLVVWLRG